MKTRETLMKACAEVVSRGMRVVPYDFHQNISDEELAKNECCPLGAVLITEFEEADGYPRAENGTQEWCFAQSFDGSDYPGYFFGHSTPTELGYEFRAGAIVGRALDALFGGAW